MIWNNKSSKQEGFNPTEDRTGSIPNPTRASIPSDGSTTARVTMSKATRDKANYFIGSWRGDKSLAVSYWINGFLLTFALQVFIGLYNSASTLFSDTARLHVRMYFFVAIILEMLVIAVSVWQTVGIWRSAEHHKEQTNRKFIATLAQILICITVLVSYGKIVGLKNYYNDVFWNALGKDPLGGYHLKISEDERELSKGRIYPNKKQLTISGVISFGLARDVDDILSANPQIKTVILNSDGGRVWEGENLLDVLTNREIEETVTETGCSSACTIAFLAGKIRLMRKNKPLLGFHSSSSLYYLENSVDSENRRIHTLMVSHGISSAFANKALSASPSSMWYPSFDILWDEGIVDNDISKKFFDGGLHFIDPFDGTDTSQWQSRKR
ncbi:MAG: hypothetical protein WC581_14330 [Thermodesulfovibrionales bacterium]